MPSNWLLAILLLTISIMGLLFLAYELQGQVRPQHCPPSQWQNTHTEHSVFIGVAFSFQLPTHTYETIGKVSHDSFDEKVMILTCQMLNRACII